jgi:hypothetical protein
VPRGAARDGGAKEARWASPGERGSMSGVNCSERRLVDEVALPHVMNRG